MSRLKDFLGDVPYAAELFWLLRQKNSPTTVGMNLSQLKKVLPAWVQAAHAAARPAESKKRVLVFGMIHYWIEHTTLLSLALAALGHEVTLAFLPYSHWRKPENRFDLRRQNAYIREILKPAESVLTIESLFTVSSAKNTLPADLVENLHTRAYRDTQYSLLTEEVEKGGKLYNLRLQRNKAAAQAASGLITKDRFDAVVTPNGSILEFGVIYEIAKRRGIPVSTFEFGEQNYRMWMAQDDDVMRQDTTALWEARGKAPLTETEWQQVRTMFEARQGARSWETFERQWQTADSKGAQQARTELGLDERPLAFLPTNVLGDSLTLGRQIFIGMTEWVRKNIVWFRDHPNYQLVVRIHPGEQIGWGPSTYDLLKESFPEFPPNVRVLPAGYKVNSYDLVDAARVGLVYTTTLGLEMAMLGKPVIVTGQTHYRGKGFTQDPDSMDLYMQILNGVLNAPEIYQPSKEMITRAWTYAYRFFFEYPQPFPWHIQHFWKCEAEWPLERVLSEEGLAAFGTTFDYLTGEKGLFQAAVREPRA